MGCILFQSFDVGWTRGMLAYNNPSIRTSVCKRACGQDNWWLLTAAVRNLLSLILQDIVMLATAWFDDVEHFCIHSIFRYAVPKKLQRCLVDHWNLEHTFPPNLQTLQQTANQNIHLLYWMNQIGVQYWYWQQMFLVQSIGSNIISLSFSWAVSGEVFKA